MEGVNSLQFACSECCTPLKFSALDVKRLHEPLTCHGCGNRYVLSDKRLQRQLHQFEALCRQVRESEEILSSSCVRLTVDGQEVKVPFRQLLTRFTCSLDLDVGGKPLSVAFEVEPMMGEKRA